MRTITIACAVALVSSASAESFLSAPSLAPADGTRLSFTTRDGLRLSYVVLPPTQTAAHPLVISIGCGETAYRYETLVADLRARGFGPIYILEHRGQGYSDGTGVRADLVHSDHFSDYVTDFTDFMQGPVKADLTARGIFAAPDLIAHSMGGAIANLALRDHPEMVHKVAYVAPMMDINTSILNPMHDLLALWAAKALCAAGFCQRLAVGSGRARRLRAPGSAREVEEGIFRHAVTPGWLREAIRATHQIRREAKGHAEPSLIIMAKRDRLVGNKALRAYADRAQNVSLLEIDGPHGLHHDRRVRDQLSDALSAFFNDCEYQLAN